MKYDWNNLSEEQKQLAVKREMELVTHNGTTKDDFINIMRFLQGTIEAQQQEIEHIQAQAATMREALNEAISIITRGRLTSIGSFHNTYDSQISTFFIDKWTAALDNAGKNYHNPADVEALRQAREALIYCMISACRPAKGVAEVAIATIDKALGGNEDA